MIDKIGNLPHPATAEESLREIQKVAKDKRGHILLQDHCDWLELKLKAIAKLASRGLRAK